MEGDDRTADPGRRAVALASRRARRRRAFAAVLGAFVGVMTLLTAELLLRLLWRPAWPLAMFVASPDHCQTEPDTWEVLPNRDYFADRRTQALALTGSDAAVPAGFLRLRTNSLGLRGPELGPPAADGLRLLGVGDSLMFGHGVEEAECFLAVAAARLHDRLGRPVTAANAGVPGYGVRMTALRLRRLLPRLDPDAVIASLCLANDVIDDAWQLRVRVVAGRLFLGPLANAVDCSWRAEAAARSRLWLWVEARLFTWAPEWSLAVRIRPDEDLLAAFAGLPDEHQASGGLFLDAVDDRRPWPLQRLLATLHQHLAELQRNAAGRPLLLVLVPDQAHVDPSRRRALFAETGLDPSGYRPGLAQQRIQGVCRQLGIELLDPTPELARAPDPAGLYLGDDHIHLSARGHALVGELVARRLAELLRR